MKILNGLTFLGALKYVSASAADFTTFPLQETIDAPKDGMVNVNLPCDRCSIQQE
jgi:hypothetical protein